MQQEKALAILKSGKNAFLTGSAGTGKTFVLNQYIDYLKERKVKVAVTASTGIAATHMNGMTIHSWAGIGVKEFITQGNLVSMKSKKYLKDHLEKVKVLIIDEISMLHKNQINAVDVVLRYFKGNEEVALNNLLNDAFKNGARFISDQDARPAGGAHAYAHLWDNGSNVSEELDNVMAIRKDAIAKFSKDNIKTNQPYSVLEDVFVPLYFFHRYQLEAVSKVIGGLEYTYAIKGDGNTIVKRINGKDERKALSSVLNTLDVEEIAIPRNLLNLFPPRAMGYGRSRESFKSKTGVAFDPYGAVETASNTTLYFLLHPQRVTRLVQHKSLDKSQLGLIEVLDKIIENTIQKSHKDTYHQELQNVVNIQVLNQLFQLSANDGMYKQVNAIVNSKIYEIYDILKKSKVKGVQQIYNKEMLKMITEFKKNPTKFKKLNTPKIPDGSPIGNE